MANIHTNGAGSTEPDLGAPDFATPDFATKVLVCLGGMPATLAIMAISSVLPKIDAALAHDATDSMLVKQLVGGVGLAMVVGSPLAGFLVGRLGLTRLLVFASLLYTIAGTAGLYVNSLSLLLVSRLFVGVSAAAIQVAVLTLINTRLAGATRAKWMGLHIAMAMTLTIAAHPIAGLLGELGWRMPFLLYLIGLVLVPIALRIADRPAAGDAPAAAPAAPSQPFMSWFPFRYLAIGLGTGAVVFMMNIYAPFVLNGVGVKSPSVISLVLTIDSIVGAGMALLYGRFRKRQPASSAFAVSFCLAGFGALIVALSSGFVGVFIGLAVFGLGSGWLVPNLMTSLGEQLQPAQQGRAAGLVKASHFAAAPLGVLVTAPLTVLFGPQGAVLSVAALALTIGVLAGLGGAIRGRRTTAPSPA